MRKFNLKIEDKVIPIRVVYCNVLLAQTFNETNIYSEKNLNKSVSVYSKSTEYIKFWVKSDDGIEDEFKLPASWIKLKEGHRLSLIFDENTNKAIAVLNQNLMSIYITPNLVDFYKVGKEISYYWLKLFGFLVLGIVLGYFTFPPIGLMVIYPMYKIFKIQMNYNNKNAILNQTYITTVKNIALNNLK